MLFGSVVFAGAVVVLARAMPPKYCGVVDSVVVRVAGVFWVIVSFLGIWGVVVWVGGLSGFVFGIVTIGAAAGVVLYTGAELVLVFAGVAVFSGVVAVMFCGCGCGFVTWLYVATVPTAAVVTTVATITFAFTVARIVPVVFAVVAAAVVTAATFDPAMAIFPSSCATTAGAAITEFFVSRVLRTAAATSIPR